MDETVKVIQLMLQVQIRGRIVEGIADVCVPQLMEERSEDQKSNPQMQVRNRTAKQTLDPTDQQILGEFCCDPAATRGTSSEGREGYQSRARAHDDVTASSRCPNRAENIKKSTEAVRGHGSQHARCS